MSERDGHEEAPHAADPEPPCDSGLDDLNETPQPVGQDHAREDELEAGFDLDGEELMAVAPIGPTEIADALSPSVQPDSTDDPGPPQTAEELEQQIRDLEARLDGMMRRAPDENGPAARRTAAELAGRASVGKAQPGSARGYRPLFIEPLEPEGATARELLSSSFYQRELGRTGIRNRSEQVDEFGLDPDYEMRLRRLFDFLYRYYFRVDTQGTEHIPNENRCLIVSNHTGGPLPYDGPMLRTAVRREHPTQRELRWLAEDFIYYLPFAGTLMSRLGAVRACQENAERLLSSGNLVAVFPEGAKGIGKLYRDRYRLQRFGRGGFIRLCLRTKTPLVPCAIVGAEEANPMLYRIEYLTKAFGIPYLPITPTFPALGPLGLLPAPTKWKIRFGEIMRFDDYGPEASDDEILIGRLAERVRMAIQSLLDKTLSERRSIWFG
jgi:1-acyl-sn-glycerol-3-phosphate acyltransferase